MAQQDTPTTDAPEEAAALEEPAATAATDTPAEAAATDEAVAVVQRRGIAKYFGETGRLAGALSGYEERPQQREMAEAVAKAFDEGERLLIEAATGTGKTLAYLLPAIESRRRTVVSTATKTLQEQILSKDVPLLRAIVPRSFSAVLLKGRQNYLCLEQFGHFSAEPRFRAAEDRHYWPAITKWAETTDTGDRAEIEDLPDDWASWADLSMGADACLGRECAHYDECFVTKARQRAAAADIVVVNHHLYFADLALRTRTDAELLPPYEAVVFDEAHHLEETASTYFGVQVSNFRYADLLGDVLRFAGRESALSLDLRKAVADARDASNAFFGRVRKVIEGGRDTRVEAETLWEGDAAEELAVLFRALENRMAQVTISLESNVALGEAGRRLVERAEELGQETSLLVERHAEGLVYVAEVRKRGVFLQGFPVDLGPVFRDLLYRTCATQVFTSATLTTDGDFDFYMRRMGLPEETETLRLEPVFDYMEQALLYVPSDLPDPSAPDFVERLAPTMTSLVNLTEGRAFLLFTSYRNMREAVRLVAPKLEQTVLVQGDRSRAALLQAFRDDRHSVLFATSSFWEGVDVQGDALSLVIIDKLPFASPFDPVLKARLAHIEEAGGNAFRDYQVPAAVISLKQGFGRLIRHREDIGIIAILDGRIVRKGYGKRFLRSLPRARRSQELDVVTRWWRSRGANADGDEGEGEG